jgi:hypothetical protein
MMVFSRKQRSPVWHTSGKDGEEVRRSGRPASKIYAWAVMSYRVFAMLCSLMMMLCFDISLAPT